MHNFVKLFARHKVAANLLMAIMLLSGIYSLTKINVQFFPTFNVDVISVAVVWPGATAEDVESAITDVLEKELKNVDDLKNLISSSSNDSSVIIAEFQEGTDMSIALDNIKDQVSKVRNLPADSETPVITRAIVYDRVTNLVVSIDGELDELRHYTYKLEKALLEGGVSKVDISGLPEQEISIEVPVDTMLELGMSLNDIGNRLKFMSQDTPAGVLGESGTMRRLRATEQGRGVEDYENFLIKANKSGEFVRLGDIAKVNKRNKSNQSTLHYQGKPAVRLSISEIPGRNIFNSAQVVENVLAQIQPTIPPSIDIQLYGERWKLVQDRLNILLKNGFGGLILVGLVLFLFLNARIAFWVALGIPISFMATLAALYAIGGSINMISMFALIMTLGIIVDDAIVVGEDALSHYQHGESPQLSSESGALRMLAPVISSSLTTIAAFLPLMMISGIIGKILFDIPTVVVCVILASLVESFLVLPGHLRHAMRNMSEHKVNKIRAKLDSSFKYFRDHQFKRFVTLSLNNKRVVLVSTFALLIIGISLILGGKLQFNFFPTPEGNRLKANISFASGTSKPTVFEFSKHLKTTLDETNQQFGGKVVKLDLFELGATGRTIDESQSYGEQYANYAIELVESSKRDISIKDFILAWKKRIKHPPGLEYINISSVVGGPPGSDLELRIVGQDANKLKQAAAEIENYIKESNGVVSTNSNLPYGQEQFVFKLNAEALALGLTVSQIGRQLRNAYDGYLIQSYIDGDDEIEVRVSMPKSRQDVLSSLENQMIILPNGDGVLLDNLVSFQPFRGFDTLRHADGKLAVTINTDLDTDVVVADTMIEKLNADLIPEIESKYAVSASFEGKNADQAATLKDMITGLLLAVFLMYIVLAWVFSSYGWPLVVMSAIPFGLIGGIFGHWFMDINLTILSLFGFFGLSGIVVNDSIILVTFYRDLRKQGMIMKEAIIRASCLRLRAVLLTSLTTIGGLVPLLFETSLQAQFLIPMAVSISFGLAFSTVLILIYIPSLLLIYEEFIEKFSNN